MSHMLGHCNTVRMKSVAVDCGVVGLRRGKGQLHPAVAATSVGDIVEESFEAIILHICSMECCQTGEMSIV